MGEKIIFRSARFDYNMFDKILNKQIPCKHIYGDHECIVIEDEEAYALDHFIVIPRRPINQSSTFLNKKVDKQMVDHLMAVARMIAQEKGLKKEFHLLMDNVRAGGPGGQIQYHLHIHIVSEKPF